MSADPSWRGRFGWLINSLDNEAKAQRALARSARKRYAGDPMRDVGIILAEAYDVAAAQFEARLADVRSTVELADRGGDRHGPSILRTKTVADFMFAVGSPPMRDDLDRANCPDAGKVGHWTCGWCAEHDKPMQFCTGCVMKVMQAGNPL